LFGRQIEMRIIDLRAEDSEAVEQVANLLIGGFKEHHPNAWPDMKAALDEVAESFEPNRISRVAVDDSGVVLGWIGGIRQYRGNVWELHPLVVHESHQGEVP
jgi:aminoglycoside 6'-N-acetyltransferase I